MKKILFNLSIITTICFSCMEVSNVQFEEPLPLERRDLKSFPNRYQGEYLHDDGETVLIISEKAIVRKNYEYDIATSEEIQDILDVSLIDKDTVVNFANTIQFTIKKEEELFRINASTVDTIFKISDDNILRKYRGSFITNKKIGQNWDVKSLSLEKDNLFYDYIIRESQLDSLQEALETDFVIDSTMLVEKYTISPSKKDLRSIIRMNRNIRGNYQKMNDKKRLLRKAKSKINPE